MEENKKDEMKDVIDQMEEITFTDLPAIETSESSGPSKGFVALIAGGVVAAGVGIAVAIKRHKKKKAESVVEDDEVYEDDEYEDDDFFEEEQPEEKSEKEEKPSDKK